MSRQELDAWLGEGRIDAECEILCDGWEQWKWATDVYTQLDIVLSGVADFAAAADSIPDVLESPPRQAVPFGALSLGRPAMPASIDPSISLQSTATSDWQSRALRPADRGWFAVDIGLAVSSISLWALLACLLCLIIAWAGASHTNSLLPPFGMTSATAAGPSMLVSAWGMIGLCASSVSLLCGWSICLRVPKRSSAYSLILAAVAGMGAAMAVALLLSTIPLGVSQLVAPAERLATLTAAGMILVCVLSAAAASLFGLFLGRLGALFGDWGLNQQGTIFVASQVATLTWFGVAALVLDDQTTGVELVRIVVSALLLLGNCYWLGYLARRARRSLNPTQPAFESAGADGVQ